MPTIGLTQGQRARVDWQDWKELAEFKWCAGWNKNTKSFYAIRPGPQRSTISMARIIMRLESGDKQQVDHLDHDTLDNRRRNLRIVTNRENAENRQDQSTHGVGVDYIRRRTPLRKPYRVSVLLGLKRHYLGYFATADDAQKARQRFLEDHDGSEKTG